MKEDWKVILDEKTLDSRLNLSGVFNGLTSIILITFDLHLIEVINIKKLLFENPPNTLSIIIIATAILIMALPFGIFMNIISYIILQPFVSITKFCIMKLMHRFWICEDVFYEWCNCVKIKDFKEFKRLMFLTRSLYYYLKDENCCINTVKFIDRYIGIFILFRTLAFIQISMIVAGTILTSASHQTLVLLTISAIIFFFISCLSDMYVMPYLFRRLYIQFGYQTDCSFENLIKSLINYVSQRKT